MIEFGIDIAGEDNQTILHHKVSCKVQLVLTEQDALLARSDFGRIYHGGRPPPNLVMSAHTGAPDTSAGSVGGAGGVGIGIGPSAEGPPLYMRHGPSGGGRHLPSNRPGTNHASISFDRLLVRLQSELDKSRETGLFMDQARSGLDHAHQSIVPGASPGTYPASAASEVAAPSTSYGPSQSPLPAAGCTHGAQSSLSPEKASSAPPHHLEDEYNKRESQIKQDLASLQSTSQAIQTALQAQSEHIHLLDTTLEQNKHTASELAALRQAISNRTARESREPKHPQDSWSLSGQHEDDDAESEARSPPPSDGEERHYDLDKDRGREGREKYDRQDRPYLQDHLDRYGGQSNGHLDAPRKTEARLIPQDSHELSPPSRWDTRLDARLAELEAGVARVIGSVEGSAPFNPGQAASSNGIISHFTLSNSSGQQADGYVNGQSVSDKQAREHVERHANEQTAETADGTANGQTNGRVPPDTAEAFPQDSGTAIFGDSSPSENCRDLSNHPTQTERDPRLVDLSARLDHLERVCTLESTARTDWEHAQGTRWQIWTEQHAALLAQLETVSSWVAHGSTRRPAPGSEFESHVQSGTPPDPVNLDHGPATSLAGPAHEASATISATPHAVSDNASGGTTTVTPARPVGPETTMSDPPTTTILPPSAAQPDSSALEKSGVKTPTSKPHHGRWASLPRASAHWVGVAAAVGALAYWAVREGQR